MKVNLMTIRRILSKIVGVIQIGIGGGSMVFAFLVYYNVFGTGTMLGISMEGVGLYLWIFIIFGLLSVISGIILYYEQERSGLHG
jgi:hypothetical protein